MREEFIDLSARCGMRKIGGSVPGICLDKPWTVLDSTTVIDHRVKF